MKTLIRSVSNTNVGGEPLPAVFKVFENAGMNREKALAIFHFEKSIICWKSSFLQNREKASFLFKTSKQYSHHFLFCSNRHQKVELKFYSTSRQIKFDAHSRT